MKYKLRISDRTRIKRVGLFEGEYLPEAIAKAIGQRCIGYPNLDSQSEHGTSSWQAMVRTGPTVAGATPFKNIWITVIREDV